MSAAYQNPGLISFVIPVFNEEGTVQKLHEEISAVADHQGYPVEIIMIDDGSTDGSWELISGLSRQDDRVMGIRFRRNFGKAASLRAGFDQAAGEIVVMMDADLQDDPAELPRMLEKLQQDLDVVSGWKKKRHDPWHKRYPSKGFNALVNWLSGMKLHDHNCGFKCLRREVIDSIELYGERHRFVPVLANARGFRVGEIPVQHRPRTSGESKYGWSRIPKGLMDIFTISMVTRFQNRPQHWLGSAGLFLLALSVVCVGWLAGSSIYSWLSGGPPVQWASTATFFMSLTCVILGVQFLAIGLVAELVVALQSPKRDVYCVLERTESTALSTFQKRAA